MPFKTACAAASRVFMNRCGRASCLPQRENRRRQSAREASLAARCLPRGSAAEAVTGKGRKDLGFPPLCTLESILSLKWLRVEIQGDDGERKRAGQGPHRRPPAARHDYGNRRASFFWGVLKCFSFFGRRCAATSRSAFFKGKTLQAPSQKDGLFYFPRQRSPTRAGREIEGKRRSAL